MEQLGLKVGQGARARIWLEERRAIRGRLRSGSTGGVRVEAGSVVGEEQGVRVMAGFAAGEAERRVGFAGGGAVYTAPLIVSTDELNILFVGLLLDKKFHPMGKRVLEYSALTNTC
jgi:hypothetical protein